VFVSSRAYENTAHSGSSYQSLIWEIKEVYHLLSINKRRKVPRSIFYRKVSRRLNKSLYLHIFQGYNGKQYVGLADAWNLSIVIGAKPLTDDGG